MRKKGCEVPGCCPSRCDARIGTLTCDLSKGHGGDHYNDKASTCFGVAQ